MFTGIIENIAALIAKEQHSAGISLCFKWLNKNKISLKNGDSIAVNGCCLTVVKYDDTKFSLEISPETLSLTTFNKMQIGSRVNVEAAATLSTVLGGHLVSGHVDAIAFVNKIEKLGEHTLITFLVPKSLSKFIAKKGSICIDGVSLTVNDIGTNTFSINVIPYTMKHTIMHSYKQNSVVHIEIDLIARYVERLLQADILSMKEEVKDV